MGKRPFGLGQTQVALDQVLSFQSYCSGTNHEHDTRFPLYENHQQDGFRLS